MPFNNGKGSVPKPIEGASNNGMSNSFPKYSPDGKWIVFVKAQNGQLMRPDGKLYIIPAEGGQAREMNCNLKLMNSWHSWSPNSRWLVFSSKGFSPFTQMFLTHIDENGNDTPAILIPNSTAANRAVNIPEFLNNSADAIVSISAPTQDSYRHLKKGVKLAPLKEYSKARMEFEKSLRLNPDEPEAHNNLAWVLIRQGDIDGAIEHLNEALRLRPDYADAHYNLGDALSSVEGRLDEAVIHYYQALQIKPDFVDAHCNLAYILVEKGQIDSAVIHFKEALRLRPDWVAPMDSLAWILATHKKTKFYNPEEAIRLSERACELTNYKTPELLDTLAVAYAAAGKFSKAVATAEKALELARSSKQKRLMGEIQNRLRFYKAGKAYIKPWLKD
jgi:tetratricopeptide (TPR) repeat protein